MDIQTAIGLDIAVTVICAVLLFLNLRKAVWTSEDKLVRELSAEMTAGFDNQNEESEGGMNFDKIITTFVALSDKAKVTFLYRLVAVLDVDLTATLEQYIDLKRRKNKKSESKQNSKT